MIKKIKDIIQGKASIREKRSSKWNKIRKEHLKKNPRCVVCNGKKSLEVHHIKPFNSHPELELDPNNLVTLCENKRNGVNCHLLFGHLGNYRSINPNVLQDVVIWFIKISKRKQSKP